MKRLFLGLWNHVFLFSNLSLFVFLPFAYLFTESEGFEGHKKVRHNPTICYTRCYDNEILFRNWFFIVGRNGESVRDRDGTLSLGHSRARNNLRPVGSIRLSKLESAHIAQ